jgi:hypothetical protein
MRFLKVIVIPVVILGIGALITLGVYSDLPNSAKILLVPLLGELSLLFYFWKYRLTKNTTSGVFYIYMTFLVLLVFVVKIIATYLYARGTITWMPYSVIYFAFVGLVFIAGWILKIIYGGVNKSIKMQFKGEGNLAKMRDLCKETIHVLEQNKQDSIRATRLMKEVLETIEFSDPVTHKKVIPLEKNIIEKLEKTLYQAKHKLFHKIRDVVKGSTGVLQLLEERNEVLKQYK